MATVCTAAQPRQYPVSVSLCVGTEQWTEPSRLNTGNKSASPYYFKRSSSNLAWFSPPECLTSTSSMKDQNASSLSRCLSHGRDAAVPVSCCYSTAYASPRQLKLRPGSGLHVAGLMMPATSPPSRTPCACMQCSGQKPCMCQALAQADDHRYWTIGRRTLR